MALPPEGADGRVDPARAPAPGDQRSPVRGLLLVAGGVALALVLHRLVGSIGVLTWAVLAGAALASAGAVPEAARRGLDLASTRLLRVGIVLLGLSLSVVSIAALGAVVVGLVALTMLLTIVVTVWVGRLLAMGRARTLLMAAGFAVCGASAVAAMQATAEADEEDVAVAVAMVTLWGTVAMLAVPVLQVPLGLTDEQVGVWAGASVHEVGQVVAAAGPAGGAAVAVAVVVKLTRVLLLVPLVLGVSLLRARSGRPSAAAARRPALVPLFVLGFAACVALRSSGVVPGAVLDVAAEVQVLALTGAMFALGTGVRVVELVRRGGGALVLGAVSTAVIALTALSWTKAWV